MFSKVQKKNNSNSESINFDNKIQIFCIRHQQFYRTYKE